MYSVTTKHRTDRSECSNESCIPCWIIHHTHTCPTARQMSTTLTRRTCTCYRSTVNSTRLYFSTRPSIPITVLSTVHDCTSVLGHLSQSQYCQQYTTVLQYSAIYHNHSTVNSTQVYFSTQPFITITIIDRQQSNWVKAFNTYIMAMFCLHFLTCLIPTVLMFPL